jgi:rare lipoprotein A
MRLRARLSVAGLLALAGCAGHHQMVADAPVKIGKPYRVAGITYTPNDDRDYDQSGLASWYGPGQGRNTANGERFDPKRIGAAHKTLPLPSYVEVTALGTGRRIIVRVNDRGPFVANRIIDLSYAAAQLLGVARTGVSRVRVRRVFPDEATRRALRSGRPAEALPSVRADAGLPALARVDAAGYQSSDLPAERISDPQ